MNVVSGAPLGGTWTIDNDFGDSAVFTLNTMRNSYSSMTQKSMRVVPDNSGDGDLMDSRFNGSENNRGDGKSGKVNLTVSSIPYDTYDVIFYLSRNMVAYGDSTGVIIFNGTSTNFTSSTLFDGTYTEIINSGDNGHYIVFEDVTGDSFTAEVYGNGSNELGLCGFQIRDVTEE